MKLQLMVLMAAMTFVQLTAAQESNDDPFDLGNVESPSDIEQSKPIDLTPARKAKPVERVNLFDSLEQPSRSASRSYREDRKMTAAELRQARALYRSQQRIQRLEMYKWLGYEPLRPNWVSVPSMTSRYQNRTIYVPVYLYSR